MRLLVNAMAVIFYYGALFVLFLMASATALAVSFMLRPYLLQNLPEIQNMLGGYLITAISCTPFFFVIPFLRRIRHFFGLNFLNYFTDLFGYPTSDKDSPFTWVQ